jgi:hypothetical protein
MRTEYFNIGDDDWGIVLCYDYDMLDYDRIWSILRATGMPDEKAQAAMGILSKQDTGMTYTLFPEMMSFLFIGNASSDAEWFDTLIHELKHVVEHISEFYRVEPTSEPAAYLQGEIGRQMFPLIMRKMCKQKEEGY